MAYQFTPKTEAEVQEASLCPKGLNPFTVMESAETVSKSEKNAGKPLIKLKLNIHGEDGDYHCYEYIADWYLPHKFRHFFFTIGLGSAYEGGVIDAANNALAGRSGWADVGIEPAKGNFRAKNIILDFKPQGPDKVAASAAAPTYKAMAQPAAGASVTTTTANVLPADDDVPF